MPFQSDSAPALPPKRLRALVPCRMVGTTLGAGKPFGFAVTDRRLSAEGVDRWAFRSELIYLGASCWNGN
jgi:hypothetical protein